MSFFFSLQGSPLPGGTLGVVVFVQTRYSSGTCTSFLLKFCAKAEDVKLNVLCFYIPCLRLTH